MDIENFLPKNPDFLPKNPDMDGYGSGRTGWSEVGLRILPREGLYFKLCAYEIRVKMVSIFFSGHPVYTCPLLTFFNVCMYVCMY